MMASRARWWPALVLLGAFVLLTGLAHAKIPKNVLVIAESHENFKTFDPAVCFEIPTSNFVHNMYAKLVFVGNVNGEFVVEPDLAERWEVLPDGKTWMFHLRKGLAFANGDPLTADDVVYSLRRVVKLKKSPSWLFTDVLGLTEASISAPDSLTVQVVTNGAPSNEVLTNLGNSPGGVVNQKEIQAHEKDGDMGMAWLAQHSAGAGAYYLKEWKRNETLVLAANKRWWKGAPALQTVIVKDVPEASDRYLLVKKGDADVAFHLIPEQFKSLENHPSVRVVTTPGQSMEYVGMNAGWGPFQDSRVRQAVKYAIDYDAIIDQVNAGFAIINQGFLAKGYIGYHDTAPFKQDLAKAKTLLAEAGYADGFDVELVTNTREERRNQAVVVQENLARIGIRASINIMPAAQMYTKFRERGINLIVAGWGIDYPDANALSHPFANHRVKQLAWRLAWSDDKAADLVEAAGREADEAKRRQMYKELTAYWQQTGPFAMLYQKIEAWAVNKAVKGADEAFAGYSVHLDLSKMSK